MPLVRDHAYAYNGSSRAQCAVCDIDSDLTKIDGFDYCDECRDSYFTQCSKCNEWSRNGSLTEVGNESYCYTCLILHFHRCFVCSDWVLANEATLVGYNYYCETCFENNCSQCPMCDDWFDNEDLDETGCCQDCYEAAEEEEEEEEEEDSLHSYRYTPDLIFHDTGSEPHRPSGATPYLGLELELVAPSHVRDVVDATENAHCDLFYCKSDGSLDESGVEVVSHPMTLGFAQGFDWEALVSSLPPRAKSWDAPCDCGIHVHISRAAFRTKSHLARFCQLFDRNEGHWTTLAGRSTSHWAAFQKPLSDILIVAGKHEPSDRYRAVNLCNDATVEVRIFRGSLKASTIRGDLEVVHAAWAYTCTLSYRDVVAGALDFDRFRVWASEQTEYRTLTDLMDRRFGPIEAEEVAA